MLISTYNTWNDAKSDVGRLIQNFQRSVDVLGKRVVENKNLFELVLETPNTPFPQSVIPIRYYSDSDEYGFNNNRYKDILLNGTLIGLGKPPRDLQQHNYILPTLDRIWSSSFPMLLSTDQFYTSYRYNFIYSMKNRTNKTSTDAQRRSTQMIFMSRYRRGSAKEKIMICSMILISALTKPCIKVRSRTDKG
ncbi:hypothetical protein [Vibrio algicola]|nr:hypothetical protein [Vibrio algicola]